MTNIMAKFKEKPLACIFSITFLLFAAMLRFVLLDNKPIHFDESINMWFVQRIWEDGYFTYDPTNYHGPLMFYMVHFVQFFTGFDFLSTRIVASIFSFLTIFILWMGPVKHRTAFRWASLLLLVSPAMSFYGRSGIHESSFVFFQVLGFMSFHYLTEKEFKKFWWAFAASLLGMMALKETFVVLILALVPAFLMVMLTERKTIKYSVWWKDLKLNFKKREVYMPLFAMLLLFIGVYSGFGGNPKGLRDFFVALMPWLKTGVGGSGHEKEFLHWTKLMGVNEFAVLVGYLVAIPFALKNKWIRFYLVMTFFLWLIYSAIPYKTPWCIISIIWPFAIVSGLVLEDITTRWPGWQRAVACVLVFGMCAWEAKIQYQIVYNNPIDMTHPYVYVNSTYQMKEFIAKTQELVREQPLLREQTVQVGTEESWPIPIVFAKFYNLSYFKTNQKVEDGALIYMVDTKDQKIIEDKLKETGKAGEYGVFTLDVRQSRSPIYVYVKRDSFQNRFSWELKDIGAPL
ncbi:MAG: glycosyltransferase family 39 protein [Bdellovibrionales bacterium]|nr:glycosyltransferase family 39 protein [Bdellovibrionales bacterium]